MRLSADVLSSAEQRTNALGEREIVLRGLAIPSIEHLAVTRDLFDAIDLADNRIVRLENFPRLLRLSSLFLSGNLIESIDAMNLEKNTPNLSNLVLTDNRISGLHEIANIGKSCPKLQFLTLLGNPVIRRQHYRLYTIHKIPSLKVLDFVKVKDAERDRAKRLASSAAGAALEGDIRIEAREAAVAIAAAAATNASNSSISISNQSFTPDTFITNFTTEQKLQIKQLIANAKSPMEIEYIRNCVNRGEFPSSLLPSQSVPLPPLPSSSSYFHSDIPLPPPPLPSLSAQTQSQQLDGNTENHAFHQSDESTVVTSHTKKRDLEAGSEEYCKNGESSKRFRNDHSNNTNDDS